MKGDLDRSTGKKIATGKNDQQSITQSQFYTLLSHAKCRGKVLLLNFDPEHIKGCVHYIFASLFFKFKGEHL